MSGMTAASPSTDTAPPSSTITSPTAGAAIADGTRVTISGHRDRRVAARSPASRSRPTAARRWHPATGHDSWSYSWIAHGAPSTTIKARAVDDSGNLESAIPSVSVNIGCPCTMAGPNVTPAIARPGRHQRGRGRRPLQGRSRRDASPACASTRRRPTPARTSATCGRRTGRCSHAGRSAGETATGWQQLTFTTPVDITAGTTYVASYYAPRGHYSASPGYYYMPSPTGGNTLDSPPLHAISANGGGANGVYSYAGRHHVPDVDVRRGELRRSTSSSSPKLPPGPDRHADGDAPGPAPPPSTSARRPPAARRRATSSRRSSARRRRPPTTVDGQPAGDVRDASAASTPGPRTRSRSRRRTAAAPARSRLPPTRSRRPRRRRPARRPALIAERGQPAGDGPLDRAERRRRARSRATRSRRTSAASRRPTTAVTGSPAPTTGVVTGPHQRHGVHVHRSGDELGRHRAATRPRRAR